MSYRTSKHSFQLTNLDATTHNQPKPVAKMNTEELTAYYAQLRAELNPTTVVTEFVSHRLMNVEWALEGGFADTIETCMSEMREVFEKRRLGDDLLMEVLLTSNASEALRASFVRIWDFKASLDRVNDLESLAELAVYCFTHVIFKNQP